MPPVYLDNNATTRVDDRVVQAMLPMFTEQFGNASSKHASGMMAAAAVQAARGEVQRLIGASSDSEIVFTSGGTESDNLAVLSSLEAQEGRDEVVVSSVEHPAVLSLCDHLSRTRGIAVHRIGVDGWGRLDMDAYREALGPRTALVSIQWANNETGTVFPVLELARLAHAQGALFHTDAVQAAARVPIHVAAFGVDLLSLSAHKFHGPKGVGALYVRKGVKFHPQQRGGRQERGRRAGTENVPGIVGFGCAARIAESLVRPESASLGALRDRLELGILGTVPGSFPLGDPDNRLPNTASIAFENLESDDIITLLSLQGILVSAGSACAAGTMEPSHVLRAMRVPFQLARGAIRFSLSRYTTAAEIDQVLEVLPAVVAKLRGTPEDFATDSVEEASESELHHAPAGARTMEARS